MIISKNQNGWAFSTHEQNGLWHVLHNDVKVIMFFEAIGITSTQENLFVGTKEECEQFIADSNLLMPPSDQDLTEPFA